MVLLSENAEQQFKKLYSFQGETIEDTFTRVAKEFATDENEQSLAYQLLEDNIWRPNTPVFLNAGTNHKIFSACYVVGLRDSMDSIYDVANVARRIFQYGAGIGIPVGNLREKDAYIFEGNRETPPEGRSSGPITFMKLYDAVGETTKSGGRVRRAAILCSMPVWHPDIEDFIACKEIDGRLANMNISVSITDAFMQALDDKIPFQLVSPDGGKARGEIDPAELWDRLAEMAHKTADPGVLFIDNINKFNPLKKKILIESPNPCGEQPLHPFSCCNLSAINVGKFVIDNTFDFNNLFETTKKITTLMDNVVDKMDFPDERFYENALKYRHIGIGLMGLADAMFMLDIKYDSPDGKKFAGDVMKTITAASIERSAELAEERGRFHDYDDFKYDTEEIISSLIDNDESIMNLVKNNGLRNVTHTTCQPTGTTALSCDCSYGIEPCFGLSFQKNYIDGTTTIISNSIFRERFEDEDWFTDSLLEKIENNGGSLKNLRGIPKEVREVFIVAHDIKPKDRIDIQAAIQEHCSSAISSTVNLPKDTSKEEIADLYKYAYEKGLKGVTVYRDGSKKNQPVTFTPDSRDSVGFIRPAKMRSNTFTVESGNGKMYVTISDVDGRPMEIFVNLGKSGQLINTFSEALGRVVSIALQGGVPVTNITKTLVGINSDRPTWFRFESSDKKPTQILSIPDGIAKLLDRYYSDAVYQEDTGELCPSCGKPLIAIEGCWNCSCGYSRCI